MAFLTLLGMGNAALGEWQESSEIAVHLRRRLTPAECRYAGLVDVRDVRGTEEFTRRIQRIRPFLPLSLRGLPDEALA